MALDFNSAGSTRHVNHGQAASLDNLARGASGMTSWAWVFPVDAINNQHVASKDASPGTGWVFAVQSDGGIDVRVWRDGGAHCIYSASAASIPYNTWSFLAFTFLDGLAPDVDMYVGGLNATVAEVGYDTTTDGTGTPVDDAAVDCYVGNLVRANTNPFRGSIARVGLVNRRLTLAELQAIQFATMPQANVSGTVLLADYHGTGTQADYSGNGNNGTVTGATIADHAPLRYPWRTPRDFIAYNVPYAAAVTGTITASVAENDIRSGGKTVVLTLSGTTWVA